MALSHLLQPKSSLQIFRLGGLAARAGCCFSLPKLKEEAGSKETRVVTVESLGKNPAFISTHKGVAYTRLADLFRDQKVGQTETAKGTQQSKEALSDVLLDYCDKNQKPDSRCISHPNDRLSAEQASDSHSEELPADSAEIDKITPPAFVNGLSELSNDPAHKDTENIPDIKELIGMLSVKKHGLSNSTGSKKNKVPVKESSLNGNFLKISRNFRNGVSETEDEEMGNSEVKLVDFTNGKDRTKVLDPTRNKDERQLNGTSFSRVASEKNRVLVRFLHKSVTENQALLHFHGCGEILDVEFHKDPRSQFQTAYIYFKTENGLKKALKKSGECLNRYAVIVESPTSSMESVKIPTLSLTVDPEIPTALVKNPTRTIKIEQLTREMSSYHIKEALAFCESNISGYFLGTVHSVAYVEFEAEIGKERALAKQSINVFGRHLTMFRVDPPRTTVVRISYTQFLETSRILSVCRALGRIRQCLQRNACTLDVHFEFAEWPNMLKILNSLNGYEIEGVWLQAEPAPAFPSDVLIALWHQPDERKLLRATAQGLLHRLGENTPLGTSDLASLHHEFLR